MRPAETGVGWVLPLIEGGVQVEPSADVASLACKAGLGGFVEGFKRAGGKVAYDCATVAPQSYGDALAHASILLDAGRSCGLEGLAAAALDGMAAEFRAWVAAERPSPGEVDATLQAMAGQVGRACAQAAAGAAVAAPSFGAARGEASGASVGTWSLGRVVLVGGALVLGLAWLWLRGRR